MHSISNTSPDRDSEELNTLVHWLGSKYEGDINAYASLIYCREKGKPFLIDELIATFPSVLIASPILHKFVENVEQYESDNDLAHFVHRAKTNGTTWNPCKKQFEAA